MIPPLGWSLLHEHNYLGGSHNLQHAWGTICCIVSWLGLLIRATTVGFVPGGTSGRNTRVQRATELNTTGWYSVTRNPLYLGNYVIGLGFASAWMDPLLILTFTAAFWLYYERIIAREEQFLTAEFGTVYLDWTARTPVFFPALRRWTPPAYSFCWRTVLRREYSAVLLIGIGYELIDVIEHFLVDHRTYLDPSWSWHLVVCSVWFVALRTIKKRTSWLRVAGR